MEPHSLSLPNHADDPGLMKPPARIPSKANTRLVAEPGEPAALRHVKKNANMLVTQAFLLSCLCYMLDMFG